MQLRLLAAAGGGAGSGRARPPAVPRQRLVQGRVQGAAGLSDRGRRRDRGPDRPAAARGFPRRRVHRRGDGGPAGARGRRRSGWSIRSTARRISPAACRISACRSPACSEATSRSASIYDPMRDELFSARRGGGAFLNGAPIRASKPTSLANATSRSAGTCGRASAKYLDLLRARSARGALRPSAPVRARSASPMSPPGGATAMSSTT